MSCGWGEGRPARFADPFAPQDGTYSVKIMNAGDSRGLVIAAPDEQEPPCACDGPALRGRLSALGACDAGAGHSLRVADALLSCCQRRRLECLVVPPDCGATHPLHRAPSPASIEGLCGVAAFISIGGGR